MQAVVLALVLPVLRMLFAAITPTLRAYMEEALRNLHSKALATPSPWDDLCTSILCAMTGVSTDGVVPAAGGGITMSPVVAKAIVQASFPVVTNSPTGTVIANPPGGELLPGMSGQ